MCRLSVDAKNRDNESLMGVCSMKPPVSMIAQVGTGFLHALFTLISNDSEALSRISPRVRVRVRVSIVHRIASGGYSWIWPIVISIFISSPVLLKGAPASQ